MKTNNEFMPIYYQLANDLKQLIESGELKPGDSVSSESQLVQEYGVSRVTVRRGLAILLEAGLIETVKGKGNFVAKPKLNQVTLELKERDFIEENKITYRLLEVKRITSDADTALKLDIQAGKKIFLIKRLINSEKGPIGIDIKYVPYIKGKPTMENEIEYADFPDIVAKHVDVTIHKIETNISAAPLSAEEAELLKTQPGHPALTLIQNIYAKNGTILGISKTIYLGEYFSLHAVSYPYSAKV